MSWPASGCKRAATANRSSSRSRCRQWRRVMSSTASGCKRAAMAKRGRSCLYLAPPDDQWAQELQKLLDFGDRDDGVI